MIEKSEPDLVILDLNLPGCLAWTSAASCARRHAGAGHHADRENDTIDVVVGSRWGPTTI